MKSSDTSSVVSSENIEPMNVSPPMEHLLSPVTTSLQSIWSSNPSSVNSQVRQCQFNKSGPQRLPMRTAVVGSPLHGVAASDIIE